LSSLREGNMLLGIGHLHPTEVGSLRQWRMSLTVPQWNAIRKAVQKP
jgi:hypothetical protein